MEDTKRAWDLLEMLNNNEIYKVPTSHNATFHTYNTHFTQAHTQIIMNFSSIPHT